MRYPSGRKEETRRRIVEAAGRVFRRGGYHASGVDAVMKEVGMTAGGFYAHFPSKEALLTEALMDAARRSGDHRRRGLEGASDREWVEAFVRRYLSSKHRDAMERGCPIPALIPEIARAGPETRRAFEALVRGVVDEVRQHLPEVDEDRLLAALALCVGGIASARAVVDEAMADRILEACRKAAIDLLLHEGG